MERKYNLAVIIILLAVIFFLGYYLRAYIPSHKYLSGSPYEIFASENQKRILNTGQVIDYADKAARYPVSQLLGALLTPIFGNFYLVYIFGAVVIFFLGKEISKSNLGGFLAFSAYAFAGENLLAYMTAIGASGLCYVFMWASLLFFLKYLKNKKTREILLFDLFSILALTSYHTGATAMIMIVLGMLASILLFSCEAWGSSISFRLDKKIFLSFAAIMLFYVFWIKLFDPSQFVLIINSFGGAGIFKIAVLFLAGLLALAALFFLIRLKFLESEYFPLAATVLAGFLIFSKLNLFGWVLKLGVSNYYISAATLNNYIAQFLILHIYFFSFLAYIFKKENNQVFLAGWAIGLAFILVGLINENYYARIMDYSFPFSFALFGLYWTRHEKFRKFIVPATLILLLCSQLLIYRDEFSMRRYYNQDEVESAANIIALNLSGVIASDLRTSALFSHLVHRDVKFSREDGKLHNSLFYEPERIDELDSLNITYVILSENMKIIVHGMNFPTKPVEEWVFFYYGRNFNKTYDDGLMKVYYIK